MPMAGKHILPELSFEEGKNYYLKDVGAASGALPAMHPAKAMKQVGNDTVEYYLIESLVLENTDFFAALFVSSEAQIFDFQKLAILSIGAGVSSRNFTSLRNAGNTQWSQGISDMGLTFNGASRLWSSLLDYWFYATPATTPLQDLRIDGLGFEGPGTSVAGISAALPQFEEFGQLIAAEYRHLIDIFVKDFIFS